MINTDYVNIVQYKKTKRNPNFNGCINKTVHTFQLPSNEMSQVKEIFNHYNQLNMMFKTAGDYINNLFKAGIAFLETIGAIAFSINNALKSDDIDNIELEQTQTDGETDDSMAFTLKNQNGNGVMKLVVSDSGKTDVIVDEDLTVTQINKYLEKVKTNHDEFFETILSKTDKALSSIGKILEQNPDYKFDLSSQEDIKRVAKQFIEEKKRISLMSDLINERRLYDDFDLEDGQPKSKEEGVIKGKNKSFMFSHIDNCYYKGMQITVTDKKNNTKQGFVATIDGELYKSGVYNAKDFKPNKIWRVRNLTPLTKEEIRDKDLQYMFNYAYTHVDKLYRHMLKMFYDQNKEFYDTYERMSETKRNIIKNSIEHRMQRVDNFNTAIVKSEESKQVKRQNIEQGSLYEDRAKVIKIYELSPEKFVLIKEIAEYSSRISKEYEKRKHEQRPLINERSGFIRRKFQNGVIFTDMLNSDKYKIGMAQYLAAPNTKELLSFGIFDNDLNELARLKVSKNGETKLITKATTSEELANDIVQVIDEGIKKRLFEKIKDHLNIVTYYHEHPLEVNDYMKKSCSKLTLKQAVFEMCHGKSYYKFDTEKIAELKDKWENIRTIYHKHQRSADRWQKQYFPEIENKTRRYMYGQLDSGKNYEYIFVNNAFCNGLRILTKDKKGNLENGYIIEMDGNAYKLINMPKDGKYEHIYLEKVNLSQLDEAAIAEEKLDLIFVKIYENIINFSDYCSECAKSIHTDGKMARGAYLNSIGKYKHRTITSNNEPPIQQENTIHVKVEQNTTNETRNKKTSSLKSKRPAKTVPAKTTATNTTTTQKSTAKTIASQPVEKQNYTIRPFEKLSIEQAALNFEKILETPYNERSPHLIHDVKSDGTPFLNRFSIDAPDGAWVTFSIVKATIGINYKYYSVRVQKDNRVMYLNIDPTTYRILRFDRDNNIVFDEDGDRCRISKPDFAKNNPLCENMSLYFDEFFAQRPDAQRKTIPWQIFKKQDLIAKQAMLDFERAMRRSEQEKIEKAMEAELETEEEIEEPEKE